MYTNCWKASSTVWQLVPQVLWRVEILAWRVNALATALCTHIHVYPHAVQEVHINYAKKKYKCGKTFSYTYTNFCGYYQGYQVHVCQLDFCLPNIHHLSSLLQLAKTFHNLLDTIPLSLPQTSCLSCSIYHSTSEILGILLYCTFKLSEECSGLIQSDKPFGYQ